MVLNNSHLNKVPDVSLGRLNLRQELIALMTLDFNTHAEAVVFHCARILEASVFKVLKDYGLEQVASDLHPGLLALSQERWLSESEFNAFDALRRTGNDVRHINRRISDADATFSLWAAQQALSWYFTVSGQGDKSFLQEVFVRSQEHSVYGALCNVEARLEAEAIEQLATSVSKSPVLFSLLLERLLDRHEPERAIEFIKNAGPDVRDYRRVVLLNALGYSRLGDFEQALSVLDRRQDKDAWLYQSGDAVGIRGGCLKQAWSKTDSLDKLERAFKLYRDGWLNPRQRDVYLGINAAACALWLGKSGESVQLAKEVREELAKFDGKERPQAISAIEASPWRTLTRAESDLLAGDRSKAAKRYRDLFEQLKNQEGRLVSSKRQLRLHLEKLGLTSRSHEFGLTN